MRVTKYLHQKIQTCFHSDFYRELNSQAAKLLRPIMFIIALAWLPYIPLDSALYPHLPILIYFRLGLSLIGLLMILLIIVLKRQKQALLYLLAANIYLLFSTAILTGLTGADAVYMGGFLFVLMIFPLYPLPRFIQLGVLNSTVVIFLISSYFSDTRIESFHDLYVLNDFVATVLVSNVAVFVLHSLRHKSWQKTKKISETAEELNSLNQTLAERSRVIENDLSMARKLQFSLMPDKLPEMDHARLAAYYNPMDKVGGDFYDFIRFREKNLLGILLMDVSGHGLPVAFVTAMIRTLITTSNAHKTQPGAFLSYLNQHLCGQLNDHFLTAFYGIYDTHQSTLTYAKGGHPEPIVLKKDGSFAFLAAKGKILGIFPEARWEEVEINLSPGDKILFYTDGLIEAVDSKGEEFENKLLGLLSLHSEEPIEKLLNTIQQKLSEHQVIQDDDICLLGLEILSEETTKS